MPSESNDNQSVSLYLMQGTQLTGTLMLLSLVCAVAKEYGPKVQRLKRICKAATIAIPPSIYVRVTSEQDVITRLKALLSKHALARDSSPEDIARVKRTLKKERDLDGERLMPEEALSRQQHDVSKAQVSFHHAVRPETFWLRAPANDATLLGVTMRLLHLCNRWEPRLFCNAGIDTGNIVDSSRSRRPRVLLHAYSAVAASGSDEDDDEVTFRTQSPNVCNYSHALVYMLGVSHAQMLPAESSSGHWGVVQDVTGNENANPGNGEHSASGLLSVIPKLM